MASVTFVATGRDIMNALKAGKSIMVHAVLSDGTNIYAAPYTITFNESLDEFSMLGAIGPIQYAINAGLDDPLVYSDGGDSSGGGGTVIK